MRVLAEIALLMLAVLEQQNVFGAIARAAARQCLRAHQRYVGAYLIVSAAPFLKPGAARHDGRPPYCTSRRRTRGGLRRITRVVLQPMRRGTLRARAEAMLTLLAHPARALPLLLKRWTKGLIVLRFVACPAPADALRSLNAPCAAAPNSS